MNIFWGFIALTGLVIMPNIPGQTIKVLNTTPAPIVREDLEPREYLYLIANRQSMVCGFSTGLKCRLTNIAEQLDEIIKNEFGPDWAKANDYDRCNKEFGCGSGQGLIQLIERTRGHCSEKLEKEIDRKNPWDSIECGIYLLEEEGIQHWEAWSGPY